MPIFVITSSTMSAYITYVTLCITALATEPDELHHVYLVPFPSRKRKIDCKTVF